ncbi:hypothetical protein FNV43_RR10185 [Rhamnella rubrinervis]|uniref:Zinc knuckle CX2CX4HX4C domain-containing protein n=1 Tax=Rhamnella rubrinervis TaxID=2594499 RepID=A0A8K0HBE3_9ROSA|nr:hypothetical protein FNV43_RR10185 [Rhamnella rubrinervis]
MESFQSKAANLQQSLQNLSLTDREDEASKITERVLIGKLLSTRIFSRYKMEDSISKIWSLKRKLKVEGIEGNIFKFIFSDVREKEAIFRRRPCTTTFNVQIHGLPPRLFNLENAEKIEIDREIHEDALTKRSLVGGRFIRLRVEIAVEDPIPGGFFQNREKGKEIWIQFKYERLSDFCYVCGLLDHVTGRCGFKAIVTFKAQEHKKLLKEMGEIENEDSREVGLELAEWVGTGLSSQRQASGEKDSPVPRKVLQRKRPGQHLPGGSSKAENSLREAHHQEESEDGRDGLGIVDSQQEFSLGRKSPSPIRTRSWRKKKSEGSTMLHHHEAA